MPEEFLEATGKAVQAVDDLLKLAKTTPGVDPRALAVTRTQFETAFLWLANAAAPESMFDG